MCIVVGDGGIEKGRVVVGVGDERGGEGRGIEE